MKDLGHVTNYLGIHVEQDLQNGIIKMSQNHYLRQILKKFNMCESKPMSTPMEFKFQMFQSNNSDPKLENKCRQILGSLMYAVLCTRPDLCPSVAYLSRFQNCANEALLKALKRVLRYVNATLDLKLTFNSNESTDLIGYVDSDWGSDINDRKSTSGYVFKLFNCPIMWSSRKQSTVSLSSSEAELKALSSAVVEACWLKNILKDFEISVCPITIFVDNQAAISIGNNPENNKRVKHVDIKFNFIKEKIDSNIVVLKFVKTDCQLADFFTKSLPVSKFNNFRDLLGLM